LNAGKDMGVINVKFFADVALSRAQATTQYWSTVTNDYAVSSLPVTAGLEGLWRGSQSGKDDWLRDSSALLRGQVIVTRMGAMGLSAQTDYEKARHGADSSTALRFLVDSHTTLLNELRVNAQLTAQYSPDKLLPSGQMAIVGDRNGVRGFVNAALLGDSASVLRLELEPNTLRSTMADFTSQPYGFYDVGRKRGGSDERTLSVSSTGLGWRLVPLHVSGLTMDVFAARKINGASLDLKPGALGEVGKTTYWLTSTYRF
jgi:hemolysin activation/secretion protein